MTEAVVKPETREEAVLREYRHCRTVVADEERKLKRLDARIAEYRQRRANRVEFIKAERARLAELKEQAAKILAGILDD